jgi:hypothetical protein
MQMDPIRTWTVPGQPDLVIRVYAPAMTLTVGAGPETPLNPNQITALSTRITEIEMYYEHDDPEVLVPSTDA